MKKLTVLLLFIILASCAPKKYPTSAELNKIQGKKGSYTTLCPVGDEISSFEHQGTRRTSYRLPASCRQKIVKTCTSKKRYASRNIKIQHFTRHKGKYANVSFECLSASEYKKEQDFYKPFDDILKSSQKPCPTKCTKTK